MWLQLKGKKNQKHKEIKSMFISVAEKQFKMHKPTKIKRTEKIIMGRMC